MLTFGGISINLSMQAGALTWLPAPVVLCYHVDAVQQVVPELLQVVGLGQAARYPCYDYLIHTGTTVDTKGRRGVPLG